MKWNVDHLPAFVAVAEHGGISAAARMLNLPKSSVSRTIARLEEDVGLQLFVRASRDLRLTHDGSQFYQHAVRILEQVHMASAELAGLSETPQGKLSVALPMAFGREIVGPHLASFQSDFPDIQLDIRISSGRPDLLRNAIDVAVVVGSMENSDLIQQRLIETPLIWIASPQVAVRLPEYPDATILQEWIQVAETRYCNMKLPMTATDNELTSIMFDPKRIIQVNDPLVVRDLVAAGNGLSFAPELYCKEALANGTLVQPYPSMPINHESSLSLLYPGHRLLPKKSRAFISFLRSLCSESS